MRLKIKGFRCHTDSEYMIEDGVVVLLKGNSGSGKTTILQAIYWCLYGNMRNILNPSAVNNSCQVIIEYPNIIITRQKRPDLLKVNVVNPLSKWVVYEDDVAQKIVDTTFGSCDIWKICCYIPQGERCQLLSEPNNKKMELLNKISFNMEEPENYISRIMDELKIIDTKYMELQKIYDSELNQLKKELEIRPIVLGSWLPEVEYQLKEKQLNELRDKIKYLAEELYKQQHYKGTYAALTESLNSVNIRLSGLSLIPEQEIYDLEAKIKIYEQNIRDTESQLELKKKIDILEQRQKSMNMELEKLDKEWRKYEGFPDNDIWNTRNQESKFQENLEKCKRIGYKYSNQIKDEVTLLHKQLEALTIQEQRMQTIRTLDQAKIKLNQHLSSLNELDVRITQLLKNQSDLTNKVKTYIQPDTQGINQQLQCQYSNYQQLTKSLELLKCPHCGKTVKYNASNGGLCAVDGNVVTPKEVEEALNKYNIYKQELTKAQKIENDYKQLINEIKNVEKSIELHNEMKKEKNNVISQLTTQINSLKDLCQEGEKITNPNSIDTIRKNINILASVEWLEIPKMSSSLMMKINDYRKIEKEIQKLSIDVKITNLGNKDVMLKELRETKMKYDKSKQERFTYLELEKQKKDLEERLTTILLNLKPEIQKEYEEVVNKVKEYEDALSQAQYANIMVKKQTDLEQKRTVLVDQYEDIMALQKLHQNAINVECMQLEETIQCINAAMCDVLQILFDDPITVTLKSTKEIKKDKRSKPYINLTIYYRGCEYENINQLSGGEGDRISLGLVLSLSRICPSPLLLLDECMASLDGGLREASLKAIRTGTNGSKTVMCVNHEDVEGFYDQVIYVQ